MEHKRKVYLEMIRIIAIFLVIFNHVEGVTLYQTSVGLKTWGYMFISMLTSINVPLFFMVSGTLLLGKIDNFKTVIQKRAVRYLAVIFIFSSSYCLLRSLVREDYEITLIKYIYKVFTGNYDYLAPYWFLYAYLGLLFTLPFMQRMVKGFTKQDFFILVTLHFIFSSLFPMANIFITKFAEKSLYLSSSFSVPLATETAFFYPLIGYYLDNFIDVQKLNRKKIISLVVLAISIIFVTSCFSYYGGLSIGIFDYAIAMITFILIKYLFIVKSPGLSNGKIASIISLIGSLTFGIYLLDPFLKTCFYFKYVAMTEPYLPTLLVSLGWCIISMVGCGGITYLLKKLPLFSNLL